MAKAHQLFDVMWYEVKICILIRQEGLRLDEDTEGISVEISRKSMESRPYELSLPSVNERQTRYGPK